MHRVRRHPGGIRPNGFGPWQVSLCALALAAGGVDAAEAACPSSSSGNYASVVQQAGSASASASIDQSGGSGGNVACADQDGFNPMANIAQIGSAGRVSVDQSGGVVQTAYVQQGGSAGSVTVTQKQEYGYVSNSLPLMQGLTAFTSLLSGAPHFNDISSYSSVVLQSSGASNQAAVLQDRGNYTPYAEIGQLGSNNQADITQHYHDQLALDSNYASIVQQGNGNAASLTQTGDGLNGSISQTGDSYSASLSQTGTSLAAVAIAQSGGATLVTVGGNSLSIPGTAVTVTQDSGGASNAP